MTLKHVFSGLLMLAALTACATHNAVAPKASAPKAKAATQALNLSTSEVKQGYIEHASLAQLYRWYQYYENNDASIDNQLDILDQDIYVKSGLGEGTGHAVYLERVKNIPTTWKNAHDVKQTNVSINDDGSINMSVDITYLNQGILPDGNVRSADLHYTTTLRPSKNVLPVFTKIVIEQKGDGVAPAFVPIYGENRIKSLVHYWLALIEDPARNVEPFAEILADGFELNFSSGPITDMAGFEQWFRGPASSVAASTHKISQFSQSQNADGSYTVSMDFDWQGILPNDQQMVAKTRHQWVVVDNPSERFARIKQVNVELLQPFSPKPK